MNVPLEPIQKTRVHIRWMIRRDMPEVLAIEHAHESTPWPEEEFIWVLRQRNCIGMVCEDRDKIVGFMVYELYRTRINILKIVLKQKSMPTPGAPKDSLVFARAGRDSLLKTLSDLRKRLLSYRWTVNGAFPFDNDARGPVFSRLRYMGTKAFARDQIATDAYELQFRFFSAADMPSMDDNDESDKFLIEVTPSGSKQ